MTFSSASLLPLNLWAIESQQSGSGTVVAVSDEKKQMEENRRFHQEIEVLRLQRSDWQSEKESFRTHPRDSIAARTRKNSKQPITQSISDGLESMRARNKSASGRNCWQSLFLTESGHVGSLSFQSW